MQVALPIRIHMDSQGSMHMGSNFVISKASKYIDLRHHLIRGIINMGAIKPEYISTEHSIADVKTKPLQKVTPRCFTNTLLHDQMESKREDQ